MPPKKPQFSESADRRRNPEILDFLESQFKNLNGFQWFCLSSDIFEVNHNIKKKFDRKSYATFRLPKNDCYVFMCYFSKDSCKITLEKNDLD